VKIEIKLRQAALEEEGVENFKKKAHRKNAV